ncbi:MAG: hypothetical protein U1F66_10315 [bacterium]
MKGLPSTILLLTACAALGAGCASGTIQTNPGNGNNNTGNGDQSTPASFAGATVNLNAFSLGGDFPPDLQIPDVAGMDSTAFVVNFTPAGVVPIDLEANPLKVSTKFATFDASAIPEAAFPNHVEILSPTQAFLLGGSGVVYYNPTSGAVFQVLDLTTPVNLTQALPLSGPCDYDFDTVPDTQVGPGSFSPNFAADLTVIGNRLFVSMSNACFDASFSSFYVQGLVRVFDINNTPPYLTPAAKPFIVLNGFNATGLSLANGKLIATSTGDTKLVSGNTVPETDSILDEIDPNSLTVTRSLNLGKVAANFQPLAVTEDGKSGFIGSSAFSEVYEIDLGALTALRGAANPIEISGAANDFITDQDIAFGGELLFVSSFNRSAVNAVDLTTSDRKVLGNALDFAFPSSPGITGAGPMALRPGQPAADFSGPDLFVLTSSPGTISTATTY